MSSVAVFDITLSAGGEDDPDHQEVKDFCIKWCKKWCFQKEKGEENGYIHWQIRLSVRKAVRASKMKSRVVDTFGGDGTSWYCEPTSAQNMGNDFYILKEDTKIEGPWSDKDVQQVYIQHRFKNAVLRGFQQKILDLINIDVLNRNDRNVILIYDKKGNNGKSFLKGYMATFLPNCLVLPSTLPTANDWMRFVCQYCPEGWRGIICVDIPRGMHSKHWFTIAQGLETIKQGHLYDERYSLTRKVIEPPTVIVFANSLPPYTCMSQDVFNIYEIKDQELIKFVDENVPPT